MKAAYVIFARQKAHLAAHVERAVRSAFAQVYAGELEIVLSDQCSTDGTLELLQRLAGEYTGPHRVRVVSCPLTARRGMAGMNDHLTWLHQQVDAEIIVPAACDDYVEPDRVAVLMETFDRTGADMVGAAMYFEDPTGREPKKRTGWTREGWIDMQACIESKVGGSCAAAHRKSLWERVLPLPDIGGNDVWLPPMAVVLGGLFFVNRPLYTYVNHADPGNTGLEGVIRALPEADRLPVDEHRLFQTAACYEWVARRMAAMRVGSADDRAWAKEAAHLHYQAWHDVRLRMTLDGIAPKPFPI